MQEQNDEISQQRKSQVGSGDRSERIRTYNFPQEGFLITEQELHFIS